MDLSISIDSATADRIAALLSQMPSESAAAILRGVEKGSQELLGLILKERFTGSGPFPVSARKLGVKSGRLRRDVRFTKPQIESDGKVSVRVGSTLPYWASHEYGFKGDVSVRAAKVKNINNAFGGGRFSILAHTRKAHKRRVNIPERSMTRAAIEQHSVRVYSKKIEEELSKLLN